MSAQAFTPGPWGATTTYGNMRAKYAQPFGIYESGEANIVAGVFGDVRGGEDVARANARLIAAAPELYEAAQDALDWIADSIQRNAPGVEQDDPPVAQLRAALAKARGGA